MAPRRSGPSGSQSQAQSQRRQAERDESEDEGEEEYQEQATGRRGDSGLTEAELKARSAQLIRFALFQEYKKRAIPRIDLVKQSTQDQPRAFDAVFQLAQERLRVVFGMELVELKKRVKEGEQQTQTQAQRKGKGRADGAGAEEDGDEEEQDADEAVRAAGKKASKGVGMKMFILRSILPPEIISAMAKPRPFPLFDPDEERDPDIPEDSGAMINWDKGDGTASGHVALTGIRTVILCLIMCMGRVIADDHLHNLLRRLNLNRETILPYRSPDSRDPPMTLDKYLDLLAKQGYLDKTKVISANHVGDPTFEWRWGPREAEYTEKDAAGFIEQIFFDMAEESESESEEERPARRGQRQEPRRSKKAEKEKARKKLRVDLQKAAGGPLLA